MKHMIFFFHQVFEKTICPAGLRLFQITIYSWVLLSTLLLVPAARHFWSPEAFVPKNFVGSPSEIGFIEYFTHLLDQPQFEHLYPFFLILQVIFLVLALFQIWPRVSGFMVAFVTFNLDNKAWVTLDGGNNLIHLMLIYLMFVDTRTLSPNASGIFLKNTLNNLAYLAARIQLALVYLVAGLAKVTGPLWQKGVALYYVLSTDEYSHPTAQAMAAAHPYFITLGTYGTIAFQLSFPLLIWNRKARPWLLLMGSFLHLQISFVMGLFLFGLAMVSCYTPFTEEEKARKILALPLLLSNAWRKFWLRGSIPGTQVQG